MARKAFPIRLDEADLDRLALVAAKMQMSKTEIVEAGLRARLDLLEGYASLDRGPPGRKLVEAMMRPDPLLADVTWKPGPDLGPGGICYAKGLTPIEEVKAKARKSVPVQVIRGYDAVTNEPIYR